MHMSANNESPKSITSQVIMVRYDSFFVDCDHRERNIVLLFDRANTKRVFEYTAMKKENLAACK